MLHRPNDIVHTFTVNAQSILQLAPMAPALVSALEQILEAMFYSVYIFRGYLTSVVCCNGASPSARSRLRPRLATAS